jgi:hypothetical protein
MSIPLSIATIAAVFFGIGIIAMIVITMKHLCALEDVDKIEETHRAQEDARSCNETFAEELSKQLSKISSAWEKT